MPNSVVKLEAGHMNTTGTSFMVYANRYREAALTLASSRSAIIGFDPSVYFLYCLSLELHLKSYIWLHDQIGEEKIKSKYRHNIEKLWRHSKSRGIAKYVKPTSLRDHVVALIGPYYKNRQLNYLDLEMAFRGYKDLKAEPRVIPTLSRFTEQLGKSLRRPILHAS